LPGHRRVEMAGNAFLPWRLGGRCGTVRTAGTSCGCGATTR
jgi:hypothetical protein